MQYKDYYKILGVERGASQDEIKRAYRKLARKYHPDVSKEANAEERFKELGEAYEVLKDPEKRAAYDRLGSDWQSGQDFRPPPGWDSGFEFSGGGFTGAGRGGEGDFSDFFENMFGAGSPFGDSFRQRPGGARGGFRRTRGEDHHAKVTIRLEDAYHGGEKLIHLDSPQVDPQGRVVTTTRSLRVRIPPGVTEGRQIRLARQGSPGMAGGEAGDLYLEVHFEPHPLYRPEGKDLHLDLPITPWEAALGAKVQVPTLGGKVGMNIPEGSRSGQKLRLRGRGMPGKPPGDQYVVLEIMTPPADTDAKREFYKKMAREMPFDPRAHLGE
ncbi:DnaJ C-terminal domain-containing protein [Thiohalomonas denitrificans]|uniref:Curved DNA-binding protein n=1 Tax=Thiohalomonas denitrificans TaxID=415747 RepID=A0A1G5PS67_9GAMM|nr:DnaJ C-terminal domain-containing protein [Thiohalomonas denitrificans]SCZ52313.1 curved DNA-binding protein [Thiohalomonas denitrificans]